MSRQNSLLKTLACDPEAKPQRARNGVPKTILTSVIYMYLNLDPPGYGNV